jgi:hypothetical protein
MTTKRHYVHVYATIRVKVAVDANNHDEAMRLADHLLFEKEKSLGVRLIPTTEAVLDAEYAEEVTGYLVDEHDDPEYARSRFYDADHSVPPDTAPNPSNTGRSSERRKAERPRS